MAWWHGSEKEMTENDSPRWRHWWWARHTFCLQAFLHLHSEFFSLVQISDVEKDVPIGWRLYYTAYIDKVSPQYELWCWIRWAFWLNVFPQPAHSKGFSPGFTFWCWRRWALWLKALHIQYIHRVSPWMNSLRKSKAWYFVKCLLSHYILPVFLQSLIYIFSWIIFYTKSIYFLSHGEKICIR